jgi:hypothetical protein
MFFSFLNPSAAAEAGSHRFLPRGFFKNFPSGSNEGARLVDDAPFPCDAHTALLRLCGILGCLASARSSGPPSPGFLDPCDINKVT